MLILRRFCLLTVGLMLLAVGPAPEPIATRAASQLPTPAPVLTTLAGPRYGLDGTGQAASFRRPQAIALSPGGSFALVADTESYAIRRIDMKTRLVTTIAGLAGSPGETDGVGAVARFKFPIAIRISPDSSFALAVDYDTDSGSRLLRRIDLATTRVTTIGYLQQGTGLEISGDGASALRYEYDSVQNAGTLVQLNALSGAVISRSSLPSPLNSLSVNAFATNRAQTFALLSVNASSVEVWRLDLGTLTATRLSAPGASSANCTPVDGSLSGGAVFCWAKDIAISADSSYALVADIGYTGFTYDQIGIRKIDLISGSVTTVAGGGFPGLADGVGGAASFYLPDDLAISADQSFALLIDSANYNVRRVSLVAEGAAPAFSVSTFAGQPPYGRVEGVGQVARFGEPISVAVSGDGSFALVASYEFFERGGNIISALHRVQAQDGGQRVAGATSTLLTLPSTIRSVAVSSDGSFGLIFAAAALWRLDLTVSPPTQTLIAGGTSGNSDGIGAQAKFSDNGIGYGLSLSADNSFVLLADTFNNSIRKIVLASGAVTTLSHSSAATLDEPVDVALSPDGSFALIADATTGSLRRLEVATGALTTLTHPSSLGLTAQMVSLSADGSYALVHFRAEKYMSRLDTATEQFSYLITPLAGNDGLNDIRDIDLSADGTFALIADPVTFTVRRLGTPPPGGKVTTLAGQAGSAGTQDGTGFGARFSAPTGVAVSDSGIALAADTDEHTLRRIIVSNGDVLTIAGQAGKPGSADGIGATSTLSNPVGLAIDRIATFGLVADTGNHTIRRIDLSSGELTTIAGLAGSPGSANGAGATARFDTPMGVALVCGAGPITEIADPAKDCPYALVADTGNHTIRKIDLATNTVTTLAGQAGSAGNVDAVGAAARFNKPTGVSVAYGGAFAIIADEGNGALRRIDLTTNTVSTVLGGLPVLAARPSIFRDTPSLDAVIACDGQHALVSNAADHTVTQVDLSDGEQSALAGKTDTPGAADGVGEQARFNAPSGIASSCYDGGTTIVGDTDNSTAREIDSPGGRIYMPMLMR